MVLEEKLVPQSEVLISFWREAGEPVEKVVFAQQHKVQEINDRIVVLLGGIWNRYSNNLSVVRSTSFATNSVNILAGSSVLKGKPTIVIFIPAILRVYGELKMSKNSLWAEQFANGLVLLFIHEMDHLALGVVDSDAGQESHASFVEREVVAWAHTCAYSITPLIKEGIPITPSDMLFYRGWTKCGSTVTNLCWQEFVADLYKTIHR